MKNIRKTTLTNQKYLQYYYSLNIDEKTNEVAIWLNDTVKKKGTLFYQYNGKYWQYLPYTEQDPLTLLILDFISEKRIRYNKKEVNEIRVRLPYLIKEIGTYKPQFLAFNDGLYNKDTATFYPKFKRNYYLTYGLNINYPTSPKNTFNFNKWLDDITDNNQTKKDRILASFYFILTNNYTWNLFLEITGESEFDKSIFIKLAQLLINKQNLLEIELISELEGIIQQILFRFKNCPSEAKALLLKQQRNIKSLILTSSPP